MRIRRVTLQDCDRAEGVVIVIDVVRAFTTAAFAFAAGASEIILVGEVDEALALRERFPDALVMGEVDGLKPDAFDLGNSPAALAGMDLEGQRFVQRTSAGTQGVVLSHDRAETLFAASLCCAAATARRVRELAPDTVTLVVTGVQAGGRTENDGDEDVACADYLEALLAGQAPDGGPYARRVLESYVARMLFVNPALPEYPAADLRFCVDVDRFDFGMAVSRHDGLLIMRPLGPQNG